MSRDVTTESSPQSNLTSFGMETAAPHGGHGSRYSGEARLFVRGLALESGWLALTGPRKGQAGVTAAPGSLGGLTPPERVTGHSPLDSPHSIYALSILRCPELLLEQVRRLLWNSLPFWKVTLPNNGTRRLEDRLWIPWKVRRLLRLLPYKVLSL